LTHPRDHQPVETLHDPIPRLCSEKLFGDMQQQAAPFECRGVSINRRDKVSNLRCRFPMKRPQDLAPEYDLIECLVRPIKNMLPPKAAFETFDGSPVASVRAIKVP